jgi:hypothetical protein
MADEHKKATGNVSGHVERAEKAIKAFRKEGVDRKGVLLHPLSQVASLQAAREELGKAIAIIERTEWQQTDRIS